MQNTNLLLLGSSFDPVSHGITIADALKPDMPIIYANKGFEDFSGYSREEIIGKNCRFLQQNRMSTSHRPDPRPARLIRSAIAAKSPCIVDLINYKKNGFRFVNRLSLTPVFDATGVLRYYIGTQTDVTALIDVANDIFYHLTEMLKSDGGKIVKSSA